MSVFLCMYMCVCERERKGGGRLAKKRGMMKQKGLHESSREKLRLNQPPCFLFRARSDMDYNGREKERGRGRLR